jgi:PAT family acetyl-CoA transporter-like MFS transporter 1
LKSDDSDGVFELTTSSIATTTTTTPLPWFDLVTLVLLYIVQGLPTGLVTASLPFLLKSRLTYAQLGIVSLASYPYALKLAWSPVVDMLFVRRFGRRKSWIVPMQLLVTLVLFVLAASLSPNLDSIGPDNGSVYLFTAAMFFIVFCAATQDVAVDGLAIDVLPAEHRGLASTVQTLGLNIGFFTSFTLFLSFNSADFCNAWLRAPHAASDVGVLTLPMYCRAIAWLYLITTVYIAFFFHEPPAASGDQSHAQSLSSSIAAVYRQIVQIARLEPVRELSIVMLTCKIGLALFDAVTTLRLLDKGVRQQDVAVFALIDFPLQLVVAIYASKYVAGATPLNLYRVGFAARATVGLWGAFVVFLYPEHTAPTALWWLVLLATSLMYSTATNLMFVSQCAQFARVADEEIGGTNITLLNSVTNMGSSWPKFFVLMLIDALGSGNGGFFLLALLSTIFNAAYFATMIPRFVALQRVPLAQWWTRDHQEKV